MGNSSWKKFYKERRGHYRTQYPFLKDDQIAAKLKRVWGREKRLTVGEGCSAASPSWTGATRSRQNLAKEKPVHRYGPENQFRQENQKCQENVLPSKMASPRLPPLPCPQNISHGNGSLKHCSLRGPPLSTHLHHFTSLRAASGTFPQDASQSGSFQDASSTAPPHGRKSCINSLCDMFSPAAVSSQLPSDSGDGKYCLFLNEADIFM